MFLYGYLTLFIALTTQRVSANDESSDNEFTWPIYDGTRLPGSLRPTMYNVTLKPQIYDGMVDARYPYECNTTIYMDCVEDTEIIRLHLIAHHVLKIFVSFTNSTGHTETVYPIATRVHSGLEMVDIRPGFTLETGKKYSLTIQSVSNITDMLMGFYYSPYTEEGITNYIYTTMMEPTCARQVFPCFDEPDFKAVFLLNIYRKNEISCIANLPRRNTHGPDDDGFYLDVFDEPRNVPMSTYLVAFACGDISYLESHLNDIQIRTYSRRNIVNLTAFSLEMAVKTMEFFQDYFSVPYPLPKEDMIAVPTMSFNAMEHWGMITYREVSMVFEEGVSTEVDREWIAIIVSHEISHQWFGNLVSPSWWDDLWLNEGFATYMMFLATDRILPDWNIMNKQVLDYRGVQNVMSVDDKLSSHPVYIPVANSSEINEIFDLISYAKGSAIIRMMNFFLGEHTFKQGLTRYLHDFSFKTATHNDLWFSLEQQAVADNNDVTNIKMIMDTWILEKNYPVVMVTRVDKDKLQLSQSAFLLDENERLERSDIFWEIPFTYTTNNEGSFEKTAADITWLHKDGEEVNITNTDLEDSEWFIGNIHQYGFFRVNYDDENWMALINQLNTDPFVIHPINRAQIINDAWNLARAGLLSFEIALQTLDYLDKETDYVPWSAAIRELESVRNALQLTSLYGLFEDFMKTKLQTAFFTTQGAVTHYEIIQNSMLATEACRYGIEACVNESLVRFNQWMQDENIGVDPNIAETVFCTGVQYGGRDAWEHVLHMFAKSESPSEKPILLKALACSKEPWILAKLLDMAIKSSVFSQTEKISLIKAVAKNPVGRLMTWGFLEDNWQTFYDQYGAVLNLFSTLIKAITEPFNTEAELRRVELFLADRDDVGTATRQSATSLTQIKVQIEWLNKHLKQLENWLNNKAG